MKKSITDKGSGIVHEFAKVTGARMEDRYIYIPESRGSSYITGFSCGNELRMMIGYYHFKEDVFIDRINELAEGQEDVVFLLSGIFLPPVEPQKRLLGGQANVLTCMYAVSSIMAMPSMKCYYHWQN